MASTEQMSQDLLEQRADALLMEWGEYQRREPGVGPREGKHPIAALMDDYARRSRSDKRQRLVHRRHRRLVDVVRPDGTITKRQELPMSPDRVDKQSRGGPRVAGPWPEHVMAVDRAIAALPPGVQAVARVYYIGGHSIRQGADILRIDRNAFSARLERARWFLIGRFEDVDSQK